MDSSCGLVKMSVIFCYVGTKCNSTVSFMTCSRINDTLYRCALSLSAEPGCLRLLWHWCCHRRLEFCSTAVHNPEVGFLSKEFGHNNFQRQCIQPRPSKLKLSAPSYCTMKPTFFKKLTAP